MLVSNLNQNSIFANAPKSSVNFGAGLTPKMMQEIQETDVLAISKKFEKMGVPVDFKENKVIAWCSDKTTEIFQELKQNFGIKFNLPKGIFVEDLSKLNIDTPNAHGFCNLQPVELYKNSNKVIPSRVIFFNNFETTKQQCPPEYNWVCNWNNIDKIADSLLELGNAATDSFLNIFMHEFLHVFHEDRLLDKLGRKHLEQKIESFEDEKEILKYQQKYGSKISKICQYALKSPLDAVACDMSRLITNSLDKETLMPIRNPFIGTAYEDLRFWQPKRIKIPIYSDEDRPLIEILRNFWNGKFD